MNSPDPASLQNLNDIVLPASVSWWPMANGWYFLIGFFLIAIVWLAYRSIRRWNKDSYRREALQELHLLAERTQNAENRAASLRQLPVLLKRSALSAYPRQQVAALSGADWIGFLNSQTNRPVFTDTTAGLLNSISYNTGNLDNIDDSSKAALLDAIKKWLKHHQPASDAKDGGES